MPVLRLSRRIFPFVAAMSALAGYVGDRVATATNMAVEIVQRPPGQVGFTVYPRR
jgi:hypothetical protein